MTSPDDLANVVRRAFTHEPTCHKTVCHAGCDFDYAASALVELLARCKEAERERDEALCIRAEWRAEGYTITPVKKVLMLRDELAAAEARVAVLETALGRIAEWDCLNPPSRDLCDDHPWLKRLVDSALGKEQT